MDGHHRWLKQCMAHTRRVKQQNAISMQLFQQAITRVHATEARIAQTDQLLKKNLFMRFRHRRTGLSTNER